jgi:hypothetical protein
VHPTIRACQDATGGMAQEGSQMKLQYPKRSSIVCWTLAVALTVSPLMAQNPPAPSFKMSAPLEEAIPNAPQDVSPDSVMSTSVLIALPATLPEAAFPEVARTSTATALPPEARQNSDSPGETKWVILAAIVTTAAVIAAILLFPHKGKKSQGPLGTVIAAGTPTVATPAH